MKKSSGSDVAIYALSLYATRDSTSWSHVYMLHSSVLRVTHSSHNPCKSTSKISRFPKIDQRIASRISHCDDNSGGIQRVKSTVIIPIRAALCEKVPNVLSHCHTKRRMDGYPSFVMTPTF